MKKVDEAKVEKVVEPEHGDRGEDVLGKAEHGQGNDAAHQEGEQGPVVEQGGVLTKGKQVSAIPGRPVSYSQSFFTFQTWPLFLEDTCQLSRDEPATM